MTDDKPRRAPPETLASKEIGTTFIGRERRISYSLARRRFSTGRVMDALEIALRSEAGVMTHVDIAVADLRELARVLELIRVGAVDLEGGADV